MGSVFGCLGESQTNQSQPARTRIKNCKLSPKDEQIEEAEVLLQESIVENSDDIKGLTMLRQVYWKQARHEDSLEIMIRLLNLHL